MKHALNTLVRVTSYTDKTNNEEYFDKVGKVIGYVEEDTGATPDSPLHEVLFDNGSDHFWHEELTPEFAVGRIVYDLSNIKGKVIEGENPYLVRVDFGSTWRDLDPKFLTTQPKPQFKRITTKKDSQG